ncbi:hypothetical protein Droror1_Dr00000967 [Drosera rotundifolia]
MDPIKEEDNINSERTDMAYAFSTLHINDTTTTNLSMASASSEASNANPTDLSIASTVSSALAEAETSIKQRIPLSFNLDVRDPTKPTAWVKIVSAMREAFAPIQMQQFLSSPEFFHLVELLVKMRTEGIVLIEDDINDDEEQQAANVAKLAAQLSFDRTVVSKPACSDASDTAKSADTAGPCELKKKTRCLFCNKKVGFTGFKCRCDGVFCGAHRYAECWLQV